MFGYPAFGRGDEEIGLGLDRRPAVGFGAGGENGREQPQQCLDDGGFRGAVAADQADAEGEVLGERPRRHDDGDPGGGVVGDDRAERAGGERGEQHG